MLLDLSLRQKRRDGGLLKEKLQAKSSGGHGPSKQTRLSVYLKVESLKKQSLAGKRSFRILPGSQVNKTTRL